MQNPLPELKLYIKYMVSQRCLQLVKSEFLKLGIVPFSITLGEVELFEALTQGIIQSLKVTLLQYGLEVMDDKKAILIEKIKHIIIEMVHCSEDIPKTNFSDYLAQKLRYDYTHLSNLFSEVTGTTIEKYIISNKIERVKELLIYDELNITEIAYNLHYSSVAHLSNQFKKVTGLTPTFFKLLKQKKRIVLENL